MNCPRCGNKAGKNGTDNNNGKISQKYRCVHCKNNWSIPLSSGENKETIIPDSPVKGLIGEDELRKKYDLFFIVNNFVREIPIGKFIDESTLLKQIGFLGKPHSRLVLNREELKKYKGRVDHTCYYGHPKSIEKLKQEGVLL